MRLQRIASSYAQRVLVVDRLVGRIDRRSAHVVEISERSVVVTGVLAPGRTPRSETAHLRGQNRRLQRIEPAIVSNFFVIIRLHSAVHTKPAHTSDDFIALCDDHSRVPEGAEILRREKAEGAYRRSL